MPLVPGGQALQPASESTPVAPEKEPAGHWLQISELEAPTMSLQLPVSQAMHFVLASLAYAPAPHVVHVDSPDPETVPLEHGLQA